VEQRSAIQDAINKTFSADIRIRFESAPDLVSGIELVTSGQKVEWSIAGYIAALEKGVGELTQEKDKPEPKADGKQEPKADAKPAAKVEPKPDTKAESKPDEPEPVATNP
jgi:F-type H+-transporting ATPase subunit b